MINTTIDWLYVESVILKKEGKLNMLSKKFNISSVEFKKMLNSHYLKQNITLLFKKGRKGGIFIGPPVITKQVPLVLVDDEPSGYRDVQSVHPIKIL